MTLPLVQDTPLVDLCSYKAKPVKSRPATHNLNAVSPSKGPAAQLVMAKQVALLARSITAVPVQLLSQHVKAAIH